jgi:hypothetical protein
VQAFWAGVFPRFVDLVTVDEWSYFVGFGGSTEDAAAVADAFEKGFGHFIERPPAPVELEAVSVSHGCWAVFTGHDVWLAKLRDAHLCRDIVSDGCMKVLEGPYFSPRDARKFFDPT